MRFLPYQHPPKDRVGLPLVYALAERGHLNAEGFQHALALSGLVPDGPHARRLVDRLLLVFGVGLMLLGVVFIVAYNWAAITALLGHWGKFAVLQLLIGLAFAGALFEGLDTVKGRIALLAAVVLVGPLLALFGQTYQTGADTYALFMTWAGLTLAWVLASRNAAAWLMWLVIVQTALVALIFSQAGWLGLLFGAVNGWFLVALANLGLLVAWELAAQRLDWLAPEASWSAKVAPRLIAWVLMGVLSALTCALIVLTIDHSQGSDPENARLWQGAVLWLICMGAGLVVYRPRGELFMLSSGLLSLLIVLMFVIGRAFFQFGDFRNPLVFFPFMAVTVFVYTAWARRWLKGISDRRLKNAQEGAV